MQHPDPKASPCAHDELVEWPSSSPAAAAVPGTALDANMALHGIPHAISLALAHQAQSESLVQGSAPDAFYHDSLEGHADLAPPPAAPTLDAPVPLQEIDPAQLPSTSQTARATARQAAERKRRRRTAPDEVNVLLSAYHENPFPDAAMRGALAQTVGMTPRAVGVWFQNRRQAEKKRRLRYDPGREAMDGVGVGIGAAADKSSLPRAGSHQGWNDPEGDKENIPPLRDEDKENERPFGTPLLTPIADTPAAQSVPNGSKTSEFRAMALGESVSALASRIRPSRGGRALQRHATLSESNAPRRRPRVSSPTRGSRPSLQRSSTLGDVTNARREGTVIGPAALKAAFPVRKEPSHGVLRHRRAKPSLDAVANASSYFGRTVFNDDDDDDDPNTVTSQDRVSRWRRTDSALTVATEIFGDGTDTTPQSPSPMCPAHFSLLTNASGRASVASLGEEVDDDADRRRFSRTTSFQSIAHPTFPASPHGHVQTRTEVEIWERMESDPPSIDLEELTRESEPDDERTEHRGEPVSSKSPDDPRRILRRRKSAVGDQIGLGGFAGLRRTASLDWAASRRDGSGLPSERSLAISLKRRWQDDAIGLGSPGGQSQSTLSVRSTPARATTTPKTTSSEKRSGQSKAVLLAPSVPSTVPQSRAAERRLAGTSRSASWYAGFKAPRTVAGSVAPSISHLSPSSLLPGARDASETLGSSPLVSAGVSAVGTTRDRTRESSIRESSGEDEERSPQVVQEPTMIAMAAFAEANAGSPVGAPPPAKKAALQPPRAPLAAVLSAANTHANVNGSPTLESDSKLGNGPQTKKAFRSVPSRSARGRATPPVRARGTKPAGTVVDENYDDDEVDKENKGQDENRRPNSSIGPSPLSRSRPRPYPEGRARPRQPGQPQRGGAREQDRECAELLLGLGMGMPR